MKIAICTISTDAYWDKYPALRKSIDTHFLTKYSVHNFVYTDAISSHDEVFHISHLPSPLITLMKFNLLVQKQHILRNFDLLYFVDGDCIVVDDIDEEVFPTLETPIVVTKHPWQDYNSEQYDTNPQSTAYVSDSGNNHYLQACFFGGYANSVLEMATEVNEMIKQDLKTRYIAKWFDESYMNKFLLNKPVKLLSSGYAYPDPEKWHSRPNVKPKIVHQNNFSLS